MNIYEIKTATQETAPFFFERKTLKFFGQTMKSFKVTKMIDGRFMIRAPRLIDGRCLGYTEKFFNPKNNKLESI